MGNLTLNGATSGQITISPPAVAGTNTLTLPASTGTVLLSTTATNQSTTGPTQQILTSGTSLTYTKPAGVVWIRVRMIGGGGGGGGGSSAGGGGTGGTGGTTTFGTSLLSATGGTGGVNNGFGGIGGTGSGDRRASCRERVSSPV